jgi:hypothetical protein
LGAFCRESLKDYFEFIYLREKYLNKLFYFALRPLLKKDKPIVRWGRQATNKGKSLMAGLRRDGKYGGMGPFFVTGDIPCQSFF